MTAADSMTELAQEDGGSRELLKRHNLLPDTDEQTAKDSIIGDLKEVVVNWINEVGVRREQKVEEGSGAELICYGSYALGVDTPGSDIDIVIIGPVFATLEEDFLIRLHDLINTLPNIKNLQSISKAKVPLIKLNVDGTSIDMCYIRLNLMKVPRKEEMQFFDLEPQDESGKLALSSLLLNITLLQNIPACNLENFRNGVRLVKFWAKKRGLYGNLIGYLGGVHWLVLFARVCKSNPHEPLIGLLSIFFDTYCSWGWPKPAIFEGTVEEDETLLMPIQKPGSNTFLHSNIKSFTARRINEELSLASSLMKDINCIQQLSLPACQLFDSFDYGKAYKWFLKIRVHIIEEEKDELALGKWNGLIQSRFPDLMDKLKDAGYICDPTLTEYNDNSDVINRVYFWGLISRSEQPDLLSKVETAWKWKLRKIGDKRGQVRLALIESHRYKKYVPKTF